MVLLNSHRVPRVPWYLGVRPRKTDPFHLQDCHLLWCAVPDTSVINQFFDFPTNPKLRQIESHDPGYTTLSGFNIYPVWAVSRSLAATEEIAVAFLS